MQKVDTAITIVGVIALVATVLGVILYDEISGDQDIYFPTTAIDLEEQSATVATAPVDFNFMLPQNATRGNFEITFGWSGQAITGGAAMFNVELYSPDGTLLDSETGSITIAPGANGQQNAATARIQGAWAQVPSELRAEPDAVNETMTWDTPVVIKVSASPPSGPTAGQNFQFRATVTGTVHTYEAALKPPDVTAGA